MKSIIFLALVLFSFAASAQIGPYPNSLNITAPKNIDYRLTQTSGAPFTSLSQANNASNNPLAYRNQSNAYWIDSGGTRKLAMYQGGTANSNLKYVSLGGGSTDSLFSNLTIGDTTYPKVANSIPYFKLVQDMIAAGGGGGAAPAGSAGDYQVNGGSGAFLQTNVKYSGLGYTFVPSEMNGSYESGLRINSLGTGGRLGAALNLDATLSAGHAYSIFSAGDGASTGIGLFFHDITGGFAPLQLASDGSIMSDVAKVWNISNPGIVKGTIHLKATTDQSGGGITFAAAGNNVNEAQAGIYVKGSSSYGTRMMFGTSNSFGTGVLTRMYIDENGGVGINTTTPESYLDVNGSMHLSPMNAPPNPSTGMTLYVDSADGKLKAKSPAGVVTVLTP